MFQKIKPVKQSPADNNDNTNNKTSEEKVTDSSNNKDAKSVTHNTSPENTKTQDLQNKETKTMSNDKNKTDNNVELDGLAKQSEAGKYSPRPATTTTAGFSSFPGARTSNSDAPKSTTETTTKTDGERQLVIGEGINISGEIDACHHLVVEGQVDASLKGANILDIAESGVFYGSVEINEGSIAGRFEGDLQVQGRLTIRSTGTIIGSLSYGELEVEAGATIEGKIAPLNASTPSSRKPSAANTKITSSKNTSSKKATSSMDNELPFATKAAS